MNKKYLILTICGISALIIIITTVTILTTKTKEFCKLHLKDDFLKTHPLLLQMNNNEFILPRDENGIYLLKEEQVRLVCSGVGNYFVVVEDKVKELYVTCESNKNFITNIEQLGVKNFKELTCNSIPESISNYTGNNCANDGKEIEIGFQTYYGFVHLFNTCFDTHGKNSVYSKFILHPEIKYSQNFERSDKWITGDYYSDIKPLIPETIYSNQLDFFKTILNTSAIKYFNSTKRYSRGHLTANADFIYYPQQRATFYYVNAAPQWNTFNGGNWKILEEAIRNYAGKQINNLLIYTGTYGVTQLLDDNNNFQELYLSRTTDYTKFIFAVPEVYWKLVYNTFYQTATVFIGHNNQYSQIKPLCTNICDNIPWLKWDASNIITGYSYCCDYYEIKNVIHYLPDLLVFGYLA